jgi:zinc transport system permease protein
MFITKLGEFYEAGPHPPMPTLSSTFTGALLGLLGTYLVLRKMVFLNIAMTQAATLGIVLAFFFQSLLLGSLMHEDGQHLGFLQGLMKNYLFNPSIFSAILTFFALLIIDKNNQQLNRESRIAIAFIACHALSIAIHSFIKQDPHEIERLLMGSAVLVVDEDYQRIWISMLLIVGLQLWFWRGFIKLSFDPTSAHIQGLPISFLNLLLLAQIAWVTGISTQMIGSLPAFALSILPVLAAKQQSQQLKYTLLLSALYGAVSGGVGYVMAFIYEISVGASQSLVAVAILGLTLIIRFFK